MAKLTTRSLASGATLDDLIHIVITGDTSQDPDGSSYKATLSQLYPLFSGVTFSGGSGNCITDFYVTNIHGCSPITIWDETQTNGSSATGLLSFALGIGTRTYGNYSLSTGIQNRTGTNTGYLVTGCTAGVCTLDSTYGDVSGNFTTGSTSFVFFDDSIYSSLYPSVVLSVSAVTFDGTNTIVSLNDTSISTFGDNAIMSDTYPPNSWGGDQVFGGHNANAFGARTYAIGNGSMSKGTGSASIGSFSSAEGISNSYGPYSHAEGKSTYSYGVGSHSEGESTNAIGVASHAEGAFSTASGDYSHSEGSSTASGIFSHAQGDSSTASGQYSHAQNKGTEAYGSSSHAGGLGSKSGELAFSHGELNYAHGNWSTVIGGRMNTVQSGVTSGSTIIGSAYSAISGVSVSDDVYHSGVFVGSGHTITSFNSAIIGGINNNVSAPGSVILGGNSISAINSDTVYVPNFIITTSYTPTSTADTAGEPGSITWDDDNLYYKTNNGWFKLTGSAF